MISKVYLSDFHIHKLFEGFDLPTTDRPSYRYVSLTFCSYHLSLLYTTHEFERFFLCSDYFFFSIWSNFFPYLHWFLSHRLADCNLALFTSVMKIIKLVFVKCEFYRPIPNPLWTHTLVYIYVCLFSFYLFNIYNKFKSNLFRSIQNKVLIKIISYLFQFLDSKSLIFVIKIKAFYKWIHFLKITSILTWTWSFNLYWFY